MEENKGYTMKLAGKSLEKAAKVRDAWANIQADYKTLEDTLRNYSEQLFHSLEAKHEGPINEALKELADEVCLPVEELRKCNLDTTYLEDFQVAFLRHSPDQTQNIQPLHGGPYEFN
jgi:dsDNA-specific endonuclease/ATPase MutS2